MSSKDNSSCKICPKSKVSVIKFVMLISLVMLSLLYISKINFITTNAQEEITLHAIFAEPKERWDILLDNATKILNERHPDKTIKIDYRVYLIQIQGPKFLLQWQEKLQLILFQSIKFG